MALVARCGSCGKQFQAQPHLAGKTVACPFCRGSLTVPTSAAPTAQRNPTAAPAVAQIVACECGARFRAPPHLAGKSVRCPTCQRPIQVPSAAPASRQQQPVAPARPVDDFWDNLQPQAAPQAQAAPMATAAQPQPLAGHQATALAIKRLSQRYPPAAIRDELVGRGVPQSEASRIVDNLRGESRTGTNRGSDGDASGLGNMLIGGIICFVGIAVTVGSFIAAEPGGMFMLAWGPIVFGGIQFFRGLVQSFG